MNCLNFWKEFILAIEIYQKNYGQDKKKKNNKSCIVPSGKEKWLNMKLKIKNKVTNIAIVNDKLQRKEKKRKEEKNNNKKKKIPFLVNFPL